MITPYGPTAARKHYRPGRETRPRSMTIDIHSHVAVPAAAGIVAPYIDVTTVPLAHFATADTKQINAKQEADRASRMTGQGQGLGERLRDLDEMGVDVQAVMPPPPQCYYRCRLTSRSRQPVSSTRASRNTLHDSLIVSSAWAAFRWRMATRQPPSWNGRCVNLG
jgi:hypothetical protein